MVTYIACLVAITYCSVPGSIIGGGDKALGGGDRALGGGDNALGEDTSSELRDPLALLWEVPPACSPTSKDSICGRGSITSAGMGVRGEYRRPFNIRPVF